MREAVPEFGRAIDEHITYHDGDVLKHVPFGDLTRFILAAEERGDHDLVRRCLSFLDLALREGDSDVQNLVGVSFVENVGPWDAEA